MEWTPLIIGLTIAYFVVASITTFDLRVTQAEGVEELTRPAIHHCLRG